MPNKYNQFIDAALCRWCPTTWPPRFGCGLAAGSLVKIQHIDMDAGGQYAYVLSARTRAQTIHRVHFSELHAPRSTVPLINKGCANCKASCPIREKNLTRYRARIYPTRMRMPQITPAVSQFFAAMGRKGGSRKTPVKLQALAKAREVRQQKLAVKHALKNKLKKQLTD